MAIRLVLADDHPIVLHGLQQLFDGSRDFQVLACCRDGSEALAAVRRYRPDVLVLDLRMPNCSGLDVLRALQGNEPACRTVVLTAALRDEETLEALRLGAMGLVLKESPPEALVDCVRGVHQGSRCIADDVLARALGSTRRNGPNGQPPASVLTARELEIVRRVAEGLRNKEIADRLSISEGTVKIHLHNIYEKVGVDSRLELVLYAQAKDVL